EGLALEEALFNLSQNEEYHNKKIRAFGLMQYKTPSIILGNKQVFSEVDEKLALNKGISINRRITGGGSIYVGPEDVQFFAVTEIIGDKPRDEIVSFMRTFNETLVESLNNTGYEAMLKEKD